MNELNEMEEQLSRLFHASVGEPPNQVTAYGARRRAIRRRVVTAVISAVTISLAGGVGAALASSAVAIKPPVTETRHQGPPRFYFETAPASQRSPEVRGLVRATATGEVTATVRCAGRDPYLSSAAATGHQIFFVSCRTDAERNGKVVQVGSKILRLQVTKAGHVSGFSLLPGGNLAGLRAGVMAASADGSELAVAVANARTGPMSKILIFSTRSGKITTWQASVYPHGLRFTPYGLSLSGNGQTLGVFGDARCLKADRPRCDGPGFELVVAQHAPRGGRLSSGGRVVLTQDQVTQNRLTSLQTAAVSADGASVIVVLRGQRGLVSRNSLSTGKRLRVLYRVPADGSFVGAVSVDPSTGLLLLTGLASPGQHGLRLLNGWLDHGKLTGLQPTRGLFQSEVW